MDVKSLCNIIRNYDYRSKSGHLLHLYGSIPLAKEKSCVVISKILLSTIGKHFDIYNDKIIELPCDKYHNKLRFVDYFDSLLSSKDTRGINYEGFIAGIFGGTINSGKGKHDVIINDKSWSIKFVDSNKECPNISFIKNDVYYYDNNMADYIIKKYKNVYNLFKSNDNEIKEKVFDISFNMVDGFIISYPVLNNNVIYVYIIDKNDMKNFICSGNVVKPRYNGQNWSIRISTKYQYISNPTKIYIPKIKNEEIDNMMRYDVLEWGVKIFGFDIANRIRPDVLIDIKNNINIIFNNIKNYEI